MSCSALSRLFHLVRFLFEFFVRQLITFAWLDPSLERREKISAEKTERRKHQLDCFSPKLKLRSLACFCLLQYLTFVFFSFKCFPRLPLKKAHICYKWGSRQEDGQKDESKMGETLRFRFRSGPLWWSSGRRTRLLPNDSSSNPVDYAVVVT